MFVSVIICTYRRADDVGRALESLCTQTHRTFEVLVVDGSGDDSAVRETVRQAVRNAPWEARLQCIASEAGLTRQRNVGIAHAQGDVLCFLDDDVTVEPDFLDRVVTLLSQTGAEEIGGLTGYDVLNYPNRVTLRWKLRYWLGAAPSLVPGDVDHLGRNVPLSFLPPFSGCKPVKWLSGFCMVYRREVFDALAFDEALPTYGGEDRDVSMQVGRRWKLIACGDLPVKHHCSSSGRVMGSRQIYQTGFGIGRGFAKNARGMRDRLSIVRYVASEFLLDLASLATRPMRVRFAIPFVRMAGIVAGWRSLRLQPYGREVERLGQRRSTSTLCNGQAENDAPAMCLEGKR